MAVDPLVRALDAAMAEVREAQARTRWLQESIQKIVATASDAFVAIDETGAVVEWNSQAERMFGWERHEAIGQQVAGLVIPPSLRQVHGEGVKRFLATGEARIVGRRTEVEALHRDGHCFPVELTVWPVSDGTTYFNAFIHDLTEVREGEQARDCLAAIVECSEDAIIGKDVSGKVLTWNRGAELIYGYRPDEIIGSQLLVLVPPQRHDEVAALLERVRQGEAVHHEMVHATKGGSLIDVALTMSPIRDRHGRLTGTSTVARDVTEQRRMAQTLDGMVTSLSQALAAAREAEACSRRFLADAAHQLRTPMAAIQAGVEALLRVTSPTRRDELAIALGREVGRASRLVDGLLRMARFDQGDKLDRAPCDPIAVCREEVERARALAPNLRIDLRVGDLPGGPVELDVHAVGEALGNLLDNACRHAHRHVEVRVGSHEGMLEIRVRDDGPGLPKELVPRAFERFASLDRKGGSGLGLPIARAVARLHSGDLTYESGEFIMRLLPHEDAAPA